MCSFVFSKYPSLENLLSVCEENDDLNLDQLSIFNRPRRRFRKNNITAEKETQQTFEIGNIQLVHFN